MVQGVSSNNIPSINIKSFVLRKSLLYNLFHAAIGIIPRLLASIISASRNKSPSHNALPSLVCEKESQAYLPVTQSYLSTINGRASFERQSGVISSSLSTNIIYSPVAQSIPVLRAADSPPFSSLITILKDIGPSYSFKKSMAICALSSCPLSSTRRHSTSPS